jgi:protein CpxP
MRIYPALLSAALLAAMPALAQAQAKPDHAQTAPATSAPATSTQAHGAAKADTYHAQLDQRINSMRQRLAITPSEETAWNDFADTMRANANNIEQAYRKRAAGLKTMTAPENMQDYADIEQQRAQDLQKLTASFNTLYGQLSGQQKQAADTMFRQYDLRRRQAHQAAARAKAP